MPNEQEPDESNLAKIACVAEETSRNADHEIDQILSSGTPNPDLALYLREIRQHPLISAAMATELAWEYARGKQTAEILQTPGLTYDFRLQQQAIVGDGMMAKKRLILANLRLVVPIARRFRVFGYELPDKIQQGNIGLMEGVERFDPSRRYALTTYAYWWIRRKIQAGREDQSSTIRIPKRRQEEIDRLVKVAGRLTQELGRFPTSLELAIEMGIAQSKVTLLDIWRNMNQSMDTPLDEADPDSPLQSDMIIDDNSPDPAKLVQRALMQQGSQKVVPQLLATLTPHQRRFVRIHFGFEDGRQRESIAQTAQELGVSREAGRLSVNGALKRLRDPKNRHLLNQIG